MGESFGGTHADACSKTAIAGKKSRFSRHRPSLRKNHRHARLRLFDEDVAKKKFAKFVAMRPILSRARLETPSFHALIHVAEP